MKVLAIIPARMSSSRFPGKPLKKINGTPMVEIIYKSVMKNKSLSKVVVATCDKIIFNFIKSINGEVVMTSKKHTRASDRTAEALLKCEKKFKKKFDVIVDLDVTSPLRSVDDINNAVNLLNEQNASNVITGVPARRSPYFNMVELDNNGIARLSKPPKDKFFRRQDSPQCYDMNASIYVWNRKCLLESDSIWNEQTRLYLMSEEVMDIDSLVDFEIVELLMNRK